MVGKFINQLEIYKTIQNHRWYICEPYIDDKKSIIVYKTIQNYNTYIADSFIKYILMTNNNH